MVKHGYPLSRRASYRETTVSRRQIVEISSHLPGHCASDPIGRGRTASSSATKVNSAAVTLTRLPRPCPNTLGVAATSPPARNIDRFCCNAKLSNVSLCNVLRRYEAQL